MYRRIKTLSVRPESLRLTVYLLLCAAMLGLGCQAVPNLVVAAPGIFLSAESGVYHEVVEFYQIRNDRLIDAPPEKVWKTMTTLADFPMFYPWMEKLECPQTKEKYLQLGQSFQYELKLVGLKKEGTAVISELEPGESLAMTLFSKSHGSFQYELKEEDGKTRLSAELTTMIHDLSMMRPASHVKKALSEGLVQTLRSIELKSEGKPMDEQILAEEEKMKICLESSAPFDVVKGVTVINVPPDHVWKFFNLRGRNPLLFSKIDKDIPDNKRNFLGKVGNGVPFNEKLGPLELKGTAVVTSVVPNRSIGLSLFSDYKAGAEYRFAADENGKTKFSALYYLQVPLEYKGQPVDRKAIKQDMQALADQELQAFKLLCEKMEYKIEQDKK